MTMGDRFRTILVCLLLVGACAAQELKVASLGDLKLVGGEVLKDCKVAYRTLGRLDPAGANAVLCPTWFGGTSADLVDLVGPGKLVDSTKHFVIMVDALGDGVSSSPSNSVLQPRMHFPRIAIRDMVASQHRLVTEVLKIRHLKAVVGLSMGGMQAFQWVVSYPEFMDRAVPVIGSPRLTPYDLFLWRSLNLAITGSAGWKGGDYVENPAREAREAIFTLVLSTPGQVNRDHARDQVEASLTKAGQEPGLDANNHIRQSEAMMGLDVGDVFGGSLEMAAASVKAKVLVVVATTDHTVNPEPALAFAGLLKAQVLALDTPLGHGLPWGEGAKVGQAIRAFLD